MKRSHERIVRELKRHNFEPRVEVAMFEEDEDYLVLEVSAGTIPQSCDLVKGLLVSWGVDLALPGISLDVAYDALKNEHRAVLQLCGVFDDMTRIKER